MNDFDLLATAAANFEALFDLDHARPDFLVPLTFFNQLFPPVCKADLGDGYLLPIMARLSVGASDTRKMFFQTAFVRDQLAVVGVLDPDHFAGPRALGR